mgnify:CR=1 FL=1
MLKTYDLDILGLKIIEPNLFHDDRGLFFESYNKKSFNEEIANVKFIQDNESYSKYGVLRGLHYQEDPYAQNKLVRVVKGEIQDVAVDLRKNSDTYMKHASVILSSNNKRQLFIPKGFAHGFLVLSDYAIVNYKVDNFYYPKSAKTILYSCKDLNIKWMLRNKDIILSKKDGKQ